MADRAVTVRDNTSWTFPLAVRLPGLGKVRLVVRCKSAELTGTYVVLVPNRVDGDAPRIMTRYVPRWPMELFHKTVKQHLGFEDVATHGFDSVMSHVHWVYCAYILLSMSPPGVSAGVKSLGDKQRQLQQLLANQETRRVLQKLTQIGGVQRYKDELRQALADA
jgi:Transposase DDE domain